jgi:hypothetical protein
MNRLSAIIIPCLFLFSPLIQQTEKTDRLMVYGDGFIFGVKEPQGWHGDIDSAASYSANIVFTGPGFDSTSPFDIIRVCVNSKVDENTAADLEYDMKQYSDQYADIKFDSLHVDHPKYKCFSKIFFVENDFYEYVTYLNPGKRFRYTLSVSMSTKDTSATEQELSAYRTVISSLQCLAAK